jgi:phosphoglycerate dehydrogenase-like enzyme
MKESALHEQESLSGTVVVTYPGFDESDPEVGGVLRDAGLEVRMEPKLGERSPAQVVEILGDAVAAVADADPFDESVFAALPNLRVVARAGVGLDSVDLEAATRAGVAVTTTPGANQETVADHALALILAVVRRICHHDAGTRAGAWARGGEIGGTLFGTTVGLLGYGSIGRATGRRLRGFGCQILVHDPALAEADEFPLVELERLVRECDVISIHAPLTDSTHHCLSAPQFEAMKDHAIVVNTSRGPLIDEAALLEALRAGRIGGAGLDVFEVEPIPPARLELLASLDNVVLSPHIGGVGGRANKAMSSKAAHAVVGALGGGDTRFVVNRDVLEERAAS